MIEEPGEMRMSKETKPQDIKLITTADMMNLPEAPDENKEREKEYRRGYYDGYVIALQDVSEFMVARNSVSNDFEEVYQYLWDWWSNVIHEWKTSNNLDRMNFAPRPKP